MLRRPGHAPHGDARRVLPVVPDIDETRKVRCDDDAMHARLRRHLLWLATVERDAKQVALEWARSPADEVQLATFLVQRDRCLRQPVAAGELPDQLSVGRI